MDDIRGFFTKTRQRCHYCHRTRPMMYEVREGPTTGLFCSRLCWQKAVEQITGKSPIEQEKIEDDLVIEEE